MGLQSVFVSRPYSLQSIIRTRGREGDVLLLLDLCVRGGCNLKILDLDVYFLLWYVSDASVLLQCLHFEIFGSLVANFSVM